MQPADAVLVDVEKPGPAGSAQELAAGGGQEVTADRVHLYRHLPHRLAGVEQEGNPGLTGNGADLRGRVDQAAAGWHVRQRDELDPFVDDRAQFIDVDLPVLVVTDHYDLRAGGTGDLQIGHVVAAVLRPAGHNAI